MLGPQNIKFLLVNLTDVVMTTSFTKYKYSRNPRYKDIDLCGASLIRWTNAIEYNFVLLG